MVRYICSELVSPEGGQEAQEEAQMVMGMVSERVLSSECYIRHFYSLVV